MSYNNKSIKELHELLVNKEISALELTKATLSDISAREPQIDAFLKITEEKALQDAAAIDARGINPDVVTDGISIAVKDNIVTEGIETTAASKILGGWIPPYNATVMEKLNSQDIVMLGKTSMDEFAMGGSTQTSAFKKTKNPYDTNRIPGGSSGGSAACVSAGFGTKLSSSTFSARLVDMMSHHAVDDPMPTQNRTYCCSLRSMQPPPGPVETVRRTPLYASARAGS